MFVVACGTAFHSGLVAKYAIEHWTRLPVEIEIASEFRYRDPVLGPDTLTLAVSQSRRDDRHAGGRAPRAPAGLARDRRHEHGRLLARSRGRRRDLHARRARDRRGGHEDVRHADGVAVPRGALPGAGARLDVPRGDRGGPRRGWTSSPSRSSARCGWTRRCRELAERFHEARDVLFIGRHTGYPAALEGALKLKEISYIHAEGYPGRRAEARARSRWSRRACRSWPWPRSATCIPKMLSNIQEVQGARRRGDRGGDRGRRRRSPGSPSTCSRCPATPELLSPVVVTVPLQLFAYHMAEAPRLRRRPAAEPGEVRHGGVGGRVRG